MPDQPTKEWLLPASLPFAQLKRRDLEECVYWLLDAMGAKDLEWRTGGSGGGAADGGRDLEAYFYTPVGDGEIEAQKWWIECKGRTGTVEPDEVKSAVNNALAMEGLDYVVIATNTQFSNPTRDWVKAWQRQHPRPKVRLWDQAQLERYLSRHPDVVLRLFSEALSLQGRFQAMESRFWNKVEFVPPGTLHVLWKSRNEIEITALGMFSLIANEFANGSVVSRPWGAAFDSSSILDVLSSCFDNLAYLTFRCERAGVDQEIIGRSFAYLILAALDSFSAEDVTKCILDSLRNQSLFHEEIQNLLVMPVVQQLLYEIQDVCCSDCKRMVTLDRAVLPEDNDEVDDYWLRLEVKESVEEPPSEARRALRIECSDVPCVVGFSVDNEKGCPLLSIEPTVKTTGDLFAIIKRVAAFRKTQAAENRRLKKAKAAQRRTGTGASETKSLGDAMKDARRRAISPPEYD